MPEPLPTSRPLPDSAPLFQVVDRQEIRPFAIACAEHACRQCDGEPQPLTRDPFPPYDTAGQFDLLQSHTHGYPISSARAIVVSTTRRPRNLYSGMRKLQFNVIDHPAEARAVWERFSPHAVIDDEWDFRHLWTKDFDFPFHFIVGHDRGEPIGLLPLTLNTVKGLGAKYLHMREPFLEFFGGIDIDDTRVWVLPGYEYAIPDFLRQITAPAKLTYLRDPYGFDGHRAIHYLDRYEIGLRDFVDVEDFMQKTLGGRSRQRLRNRLHRIERSYEVDVGNGHRDDLETLFQFSVERFGERSSFNMEQRRDVFRNFLGRFAADLFCVYLDADVRAVSMGIVHNGTYTTLSIGYDLRVRDLSKYLIVAQLGRALALGCTKFDAGKGENGWKSHFNLTAIPQYNLVLNYRD